MIITSDLKMLPMPWAQNGLRADIPDQTTSVGRASWSAGFPDVTARPIASGGVPPHYMDFQGVLNAITNHVCWLQDGGRYAWRDTADYPIGACVVHSSVVYQARAMNGPHVDHVGVKTPGTAAGASYWAPVAGADGKTIVVSDGALTLGSGAASALADGTTIVSNASGKLAVKANGIADGKTISMHAAGASAGKLGVMLGGIADGSTIVVNAQGKLAAANQGIDSAVLASYVKKAGDTMNGALAVKAGGITISAGGLRVSGGGANIAGGIAVGNGGVTISAGGLAVKGGTVSVTSGATFGAGVTVSGALTAKGNATVGGTITVNGGATFAGNAVVKGAGTFSKTVTVAGKVTANGGLAVGGNCTIPTPAAGANNKSAANTEWVKARIKDLDNTFTNRLNTSGGIVRPAQVYAVYGVWNKGTFTYSTGHNWTNGGYTYGASAAAKLKEGRYFISGCIRYKPVYIVHNGKEDAWCRIRAGINAPKLVSAGNPGGTGSNLLVNNKNNNCWGGAAGSAWYKIGQNGGGDAAHYGAVSMENMVLIPKSNGIVIVDIFDGGGSSTDDTLYFFN